MSGPSLSRPERGSRSATRCREPTAACGSTASGLNGRRNMGHRVRPAIHRAPSESRLSQQTSRPTRCDVIMDVCGALRGHVAAGPRGAVRRAGSAAAPAPDPEIDVTKLGVSISRIQRGLLIAESREKQGGDPMHLEFNVQVYGQSPKIEVLKGIDLFNGAVPGTAPPRPDDRVLDARRSIARRACRSPRWRSGRRSTSGKRARRRAAKRRSPTTAPWSCRASTSPPPAALSIQ